MQDPPERPKSHNKMDEMSENFQLWRSSGESCPEGTIPIRRTTEQDMLRANSINTFGKKLRKRVRRDTNSNGHEVHIIYISNAISEKSNQEIEALFFLLTLKKKFSTCVFFFMF